MGTKIKKWSRKGKRGNRFRLFNLKKVFFNAFILGEINFKVESVKYLNKKRHLYENQNYSMRLGKYLIIKPKISFAIIARNGNKVNKIFYLHLILNKAFFLVFERKWTLIFIDFLGECFAMIVNT